MGRLRETVLGIKAANAFQNNRGGTQLQYSNNGTIVEEPEEDPPIAAQQSLSQPYRQNSGYSQPWSPVHAQSLGTLYQPNNAFAYSQYQQEAQYQNMTPLQTLLPQQGSPPQQNSPPLQQGWQQQPYLPQVTQPPQTPPNHAPYAGYHNTGFASPSASNYDPSISSAHSQYTQHQYQMSPPPTNTSPPLPSIPQRASSMYGHDQSHPELQSLQRSYTVPATSYWPREQKDHDCSDYRTGYDGHCTRCNPQG